MSTVEPAMGKAIPPLRPAPWVSTLTAGSALSPSHFDMSEKTKEFFLPNTTPFDSRKPVVPEMEAEHLIPVIPGQPSRDSNTLSTKRKRKIFVFNIF